jgi:hypothetical protein
VQRIGVKSSFHAGFFYMWNTVTELKKCTVVRHKILHMSKQMKRSVHALTMHVGCTETAIM